MKKQRKHKQKGFDERFDQGLVSIDFSTGIVTAGLSKTLRLPPMAIPSWMAVEIERLAKLHANSKSAIVRQLLVEAIDARRRHLVS